MSFPTAGCLGFNFIIMVHRQTLIKGLQSQGTVALKSYLKKEIPLLYGSDMKSSIWYDRYNSTRKTICDTACASTLWNKASGMKISLDLFFFFLIFFSLSLPLQGIFYSTRIFEIIFYFNLTVKTDFSYISIGSSHNTSGVKLKTVRKKKLWDHCWTNTRTHKVTYVHTQVWNKSSPLNIME